MGSLSFLTAPDQETDHRADSNRDAQGAQRTVLDGMADPRGGRVGLSARRNARLASHLAGGANRIAGKRLQARRVGLLPADERLVRRSAGKSGDGVFFATLVFGSGTEVSARPSDSIALALRTGSRIFCAEEVLDEAGLAVPAEQEDEVEKFRAFLDEVTPEDFEA
jgi:hypothetical protein